MKVIEDHIKYIETIVNIAMSVNIENIIIEQGAVRAIDEHRTVVLYQNTDVPELPFGSIGIGRTGLFSSRLNIIKKSKDFIMDSDVSAADESNDTYAQILKMKSDDTKISYRCANPKNIQAPKAINDTIIYQVQLNPEAISMLQLGSVAMGSDMVAIVGNEDGVFFECADVTGDLFTHLISPSVTTLGDDTNPEFRNNYLVKTVLALSKQNPEAIIGIGTKGIMRIEVNDISVYVLPQV